MRVKRYLVDTVSEALPLIRSELGSDAVILSTKDIKIGGFMGMFRKRKTEVVAAVEGETSKPSKPRPTQQQSSVSIQKPQRPAATAAAAYGAAYESNSRGASATAVLDPLETSQAVERATFVLQQAASSDKLEQGQFNPAPPVVQDAMPAAPRVPAGGGESTPHRTELEHLLTTEIRDMKEWIMKLSRQKAVDSQPAALRLLCERLEEQEVAAEWIDKLRDMMVEMSEAHDEWSDSSVVWQHAAEIITGWLRPYEHGGIGSSERNVYFVGPTGVGKTTTIAKLAAEQTLKAGKKVGFITSDTYRIAAVDQLRTYANILNVPMEVVFSPNEVPRAFSSLEDKDLILMDTAGRNYRSELHVSEVNSMLNTQEQGTVFLVMSLTGRTSDMRIIADRFLPYGIRQVIFTKLDETTVYGTILNLMLEYGLQVAYVTSGQTVPDDISNFSAEAYVAMLLGEPAHV
ncbi:flagellar biosynthesis protein FlhF [Paenibacillus sp. PR3]|uniref:Flagellar biosynthesis protein FlhF n=1 Tax=Paenibacillus terricola TaxID=2763503 RepID=A0ABR8MTN3_9BACL|nr:flagellar biosynthesis protein FlhF [Paenibacillus terricola]MBD3918255.1 flagellar biosynthesis protein FlhF [Paenibacillus terricola]